MFFGLSKNLVDFFHNSQVPQVVILNLVSQDSSLSADNRSVEKFICNSVILAIHSEKFRRIISAGTDEIQIENFSSSGGVKAMKHSIEFMYGDRSAVYRVGDVIEMCKFSDAWDIPSLWVACMARIESHLSDNPLKVFEYYQLLSVVSDKNLQHEELGRVFDKTTREHADSLIIYSMNVMKECDKRICKGLIENSKTALCGQYVISLIRKSDELREFILLNLQLIPVASAFGSEANFIQFKSAFLPWERDQLANITDEFYKHHKDYSDTLKKESDVSDFLSHNSNVTFDLLPSSSNNMIKSSTLSDSISTENKIDVLNKSLKDIQDKEIRIERTRMKLFGHENLRGSILGIPLSEYPALVKQFPLYTGLDIVGHFISKSRSLNQSNLISLLAPFYQNEFIPKSILNDIKAIAISKCSQQNLIQSLDDLQISDRIYTYAKTCTFYNINLFCTKLGNEKKIEMNFDEGVSFPVNSYSAGNKLRVFNGLCLDFSTDSCVKFVSLEDCQIEDIIHCYILVISKTGNYQSYIPILQLTTPQIIDLVGQCFLATSIRVIIIFSKTSELNLGIHDNIVARCLQSSPHYSDDLTIVDSAYKINVHEISVTSHSKSKKNNRKNGKKGKKVKNPLVAGKLPTKMIESTSLYNGKLPRKMIESTSLYNEFELLAMKLSRGDSKNNLKKLMQLFENRLISTEMLEDLKELPLIRNNNFSPIISSVPDRIEAFSVSGVLRNDKKFRSQLIETNKIQFCNSNPVPCPICLSGEHFHFVHHITIDLSTKSSVNIISDDGEIHKNHIIHCYAVGLNQDGRVMSYVSIIQLPVAEICKFLNNKGMYFVKVVVIFSKEFLNCHQLFRNVLVCKFKNDLCDREACGEEFPQASSSSSVSIL